MATVIGLTFTKPEKEKKPKAPEKAPEKAKADEAAPEKANGEGDGK